MSELETVLAALHRTAAAMAAQPAPPARIKLGAAGVTVEWDVVPPVVGVLPVGAADGVPTLAPSVGAATGTALPAIGAVAAVGAALPGPAAEAVAAAPVATAVTAQHTLTAPTVGVFYRSSEPGAAPFVDTGDLVSPGQQVGIVEAMKLMVPVEAEFGGRVVEVLCADATSVEFGAPLFALAAE